MTIIEAMRDPNLWQPWFHDSADWRAWFAVLRALFGLPMDAEDLAIWRQFTGRNEPPPAGGFVEAWLVIGRRGGKSLIMALVACFLACFKDWTRYSVPGESLLIQVLASDRRQARIVFKYAQALLQVPLLRDLIERETDETIELKSGISIEITTNSFRSIRGFTIVAALLDEVAYWRNDDAAQPDSETLIALRPAMSTVPGSMLIGASSPYAKKGILFEAFRDHWAQDDSDVLTWKASTRDMHPSFPQKVIDDAMRRDPAAAMAEYYAGFRADIEGWIDRAVIESITVAGRFELPPVRRGYSYKGYCDPSGGAADSMTLGIAHSERGIAVLDLVREARPPFSPDSVVAEFAEVLKAYGCGAVEGDRYAGQWVVERFREHGITYTPSERTTSDTYRECLPLFTTGRAELIDHAKLAMQLASLERRVTRGSREYVSHPVGSHDDLATSACGALVLAGAGRGVIETWLMLGGMGADAARLSVANRS